MKKARSVICSILVLLLLSACSATAGWQSAAIYSCGTVKLPSDWEVTKTTGDGYMSILVGEGDDRKYVFVQYDSDMGVTPDGINPYFADVAECQVLQDEKITDTVNFSKEKFIYTDGTAQELFALELAKPESAGSVKLVCVDKSISEDTLRTIAKSYVMAEK